MNIGSIVKIKNICFADGKIDHAFANGRPCVFLGEDDEKMYFTPLVSNKKERFLPYCIMPSPYNNLSKPSFPNFGTIIVKNICFMEEIGYIEPIYLLRIFKEAIYRNNVGELIDQQYLVLANNYLNQISQKEKQKRYKKN